MGFSNNRIENTSVSWNDGDLVGTEKVIDIDLPDKLEAENRYLVMIVNLSAVTNIDVQSEVKWEDSLGNIRYSGIMKWTVNSEDSDAMMVEGMLLGKGGRLVLSNNTDLGSGEGFTSYIQIREV